MKTKTTRDAKIVGVRLSESEAARTRKTLSHLGLPVEIDDSKLVRTFFLMGLSAFEKRNARKRKEPKDENKS